MASNRRRYPRVRARGVAAHLRTEHGRSACQVENVSLGGLFVRTDRLEEVGAEIFVDLVRPGWKRQLTLTARITSRVDALDGRLSKRMPGMGMQFMRLDDKQHDRLRQLLRELGAPEDEQEVTLEDEHAEVELRALDFDQEPAEPLDPQPQMVWQQVQMAASEVEAAIEGALREADLPPPGPVEIQDVPRPPPPTPPVSKPAPAARVEIEGPAAESARLMMQIRGLVMQLSDVQQQLSQRDSEIERLKEELDTTRRALERALRKS